jgi:hypothetical protein
MKDLAQETDGIQKGVNELMLKPNAALKKLSCMLALVLWPCKLTMYFM